MSAPFDIFLVAPPGLEALLAEEAREADFASATAVPGGVEMRGGWPEVWRANVRLRGAVRVLVRVAEFRAMHLAQLDKRARKVDWAGLLPKGAAIRAEATCRKSKIYHDRAAAERIARAAAEGVGGHVDPKAELVLKARIEDDLVTISIDTTGEALHRRGHKTAVGKAPLRENLAALFLRACGYDGAMPVVDPMCGSGTIPIEAAEIAAGLVSGRSRGFAFERLAGYDAEAVAALKVSEPAAPALRFFGFDRDAGAVRGAAENAERAGVAGWCRFAQQPIGALEPPPGPPGLVLTNPPYGQRIGNRKLLFSLYGTLGSVLRERFSGWRVGIVTADGGLAKATGLDLTGSEPVDHSGTKVRLWQAGPL
ncbi:class I SAM-dependent RNA methyltransferase [Rhodobacterales bacterium HKCCE3408]|nr:class I SAM-dependent RNA methyltransferase [Rhodobacterales bacterium HKCCE3408]